MKIQAYAQLNQKQKKKAEELIAACKDYEPVALTPPLVNQNFDPDRPCFFFLFENQELVSFLSLFMPEETYGEAIAFTHPMARQRGYFKALWNKAIESLSDIIEEMELLLLTDGKSPDALNALKALDGEYQYTEYLLYKEIWPSAPWNGLSARRAEPGSSEDFKLFCDLHETIFCEGKLRTAQFVKDTLMNINTDTYFFSQNQQPVGVLSIGASKKEACLFGFGILPSCQGKGIGRQILEGLPSLLPAEIKSVAVQVCSLNEAAYHLYRNAGFLEKSHIDYYY